MGLDFVRIGGKPGRVCVQPERDNKARLRDYKKGADKTLIIRNGGGYMSKELIRLRDCVMSYGDEVVLDRKSVV